MNPLKVKVQFLLDDGTITKPYEIILKSENENPKRANQNPAKAGKRTGR